VLLKALGETTSGEGEPKGGRGGGGKGGKLPWIMLWGGGEKEEGPGAL